MKNEFFIPDSITVIDAIEEMKETSKSCWFFLRFDLVKILLETNGAYMERHNGKGIIRWISKGKYPEGEFHFRNVDHWWAVSRITVPGFTYEIPQYPKTIVFLKKGSKDYPWKNGRLLDAKII